MTGFVKAMRTEESTFLDMHPNANHMLNVIARRARRTPCHLNKLEVGECFIGHKGLGLTERQYRTAKKQLEEWRMVEFKKGRKETDKGTVAKLLNSKVYDINEELGDGRETEERRKRDGRATTNKECNKEKNDKKEIRQQQFEVFWNSYNKKTDKTKCLSKFEKMSDSDVEDILNSVGKYVQSTPDVKFRKNPLTWLNGRCWEDESVSQDNNNYELPAFMRGVR